MVQQFVRRRLSKKLKNVIFPLCYGRMKLPGFKNICRENIQLSSPLMYINDILHINIAHLSRRIICGANSKKKKISLAPTNNKATSSNEIKSEHFPFVLQANETARV